MLACVDIMYVIIYTAQPTPVSNSRNSENYYMEINNTTTNTRQDI